MADICSLTCMILLNVTEIEAFALCVYYNDDDNDRPSRLE